MTPAILAFVILMPHSMAVAAMPPRGQSAGSESADSKQTADFSKKSSVIQTLHTAVSFRDDGTATREETARIQIQSVGGIDDWGLLSFAFNSANQDVEIGYVRVLQSDGTIVSTPLSDVQEVTDDVTRDAPMYSDYRDPRIAIERRACVFWTLGVTECSAGGSGESHTTQFNSRFRGSWSLPGVVFRRTRHDLARVHPTALFFLPSQVRSVAQQSRADCNNSHFSQSALMRSTQRRAWRTSLAANR